MSREHVDHREIVQYAQDRVNLPKDKALEYRAQARRLRERLESYLSEHPDFTLKKMMLSGSLAKGTALRSLNDIDVACYISGADAPRDVQALLDYLATRLRKAYPNFTADQVKAQTYSVTVHFKGTGLDVDVVPILYSGDPHWYGNLVSQDDGSLLETCIPRHIEFIGRRKTKHDTDYAQVIRLIKQWVRVQKGQQQDFRCKSFIVELIVAHLADQGQEMSDYPEALQAFFTYIARTSLRERIIFGDYYKAADVGAFKERVQIIDPVNAKNNVAVLYTEEQARTLIDAALAAGDAIDSALHATTKQDTVRYWQKVFGPTFQA
jgi:tRNA nucleotidyltransferase (CCA-adding enzyme)